MTVQRRGPRAEKSFLILRQRFFQFSFTSHDDRQLATPGPRSGYRGYVKFQEESDNDVGSDNDNYLVMK